MKRGFVARAATLATSRFVFVLILGVALSGCGLSMKHQAKADTQSSAELWPGGPPRQSPPAGTIAEGALAQAQGLATPPPLTKALIDRGEQRYDIFCIVCHGPTGDGDGPVVKRGFPAPPSFHIPRLVAAPPGYVVEVITHGHGLMYSYADRVASADRWAIAAYVKTLQRAAQDRETAR